MRKNRNEIQVIVDFLKCVQEADSESQVSFIMRKVNITHSKYREISEYLISNGMMEMVENGEKKILRLTSKGANFIRDYERFKKIIEDNYGFKI
ncbi:MAG: winged helix-turn-helix domain-containing protein [Thermoplasmatales archaeon]|jgi:Predicted transcriptional regulator